VDNDVPILGIEVRIVLDSSFLFVRLKLQANLPKHKSQPKYKHIQKEPYDRMGKKRYESESETKPCSAKMRGID